MNLTWCICRCTRTIRFYIRNSKRAVYLFLSFFCCYSVFVYYTYRFSRHAFIDRCLLLLLLVDSILGIFYLLPRVGYESIRHRVRVSRIKAFLDWRQTHGYHSSDWWGCTVILIGFITDCVRSSFSCPHPRYFQTKQTPPPLMACFAITGWSVTRLSDDESLNPQDILLLSILYQSLMKKIFCFWEVWQKSYPVILIRKYYCYVLRKEKTLNTNVLL